MKRIIYITVLVLLTALMWVQLYTAGFLPYDDNFGQLLGIFLLSVAGLGIGILLIAKKNRLVLKNLIATITFLIINSPVTIYLVIMNYENIFGIVLNVG